MAVVAQLLGPPLVTRDGVVYAPPRGKKVWAFFAYLALAEQPPTRQQLADAAVPRRRGPGERPAVEPVGAAAAPRGPGPVGSGATVGLRLPSGSTIDVRVLLEGTSAAAVELPGLGPGAARGDPRRGQPRVRRLAARGATPAPGARRRGPSGGGAARARRRRRARGGGARHPAGRRRSARARTRTCCWCARSRRPATRSPSSGSWRRRSTCSNGELGIDIAPELYGAARMETRAEARAGGPRGRRGAPGVRRGGDRAPVRSTSGSASSATPRSRRRPGRHRGSRRAALLGWGSALVHAAKGRDEDGSAALHRAMRAAESVGDRRTVGGGAPRARLRRAAARASTRAARVAPARRRVRRRRSARAVVDPRRCGRGPERRRQARAGDRGVRGVDRAGRRRSTTDAARVGR